MRLKITHKDGHTTVTNAETGEAISGVTAASFERKSVEDAATVTLTLIEVKAGDIETDIEIHSDLASRDYVHWNKGQVKHQVVTEGGVVEEFVDPRPTTGFDRG